MRIRHVTILVLFLILGVVILTGFGDRAASAKSSGDEKISRLTILGIVHNSQHRPIENAEIGIVIENVPQ
jgi:hypothetical protein